MPIETFQQRDMFTGEVATVRGKAPRSQSAQLMMFPVNEVVQFGVSAHPWLKDMPQAPLTLEIQDVRTEEEKVRDRQRAAEALTQPLFPEPASQPVLEASPLVDGHAGEYRVSLFHLGKAELIAGHPDLKDQIMQLSDTDIEAIACQAEEALKFMYRMALNLTLMTYLAQKNGVTTLQ